MFSRTTPEPLPFMPSRPLVNWKAAPDWIRLIPEISQPSRILLITGTLAR